MHPVPLGGSAGKEREDRGQGGKQRGLHKIDLEDVYAQGKVLEERRADRERADCLAGGAGLSQRRTVLPWRCEEGACGESFPFSFILSVTQEARPSAGRRVGKGSQRRSQAAVAQEGRTGDPGVPAGTVPGPGVSGRALSIRQPGGPRPQHLPGSTAPSRGPPRSAACTCMCR